MGTYNTETNTEILKPNNAYRLIIKQYACL